VNKEYYMEILSRFFKEFVQWEFSFMQRKLVVLARQCETSHCSTNEAVYGKKGIPELNHHLPIIRPHFTPRFLYF
jgi:hypothetical protein